MRYIVMAFAVLACLKVWTQDRIYRSSVGEVVVQAYRDRAEQACRKEFSKANGGQAVSPWVAHSGADVTIGNSKTDVALWDIDNPLWSVKYRHPHLVLSGNSASGTGCSFDLVAGIASLNQH